MQKPSSAKNTDSSNKDTCLFNFLRYLQEYQCKITWFESRSPHKGLTYPNIDADMNGRHPRYVPMYVMFWLRGAKIWGDSQMVKATKLEFVKNKH